MAGGSPTSLPSAGGNGSTGGDSGGQGHDRTCADEGSAPSSAVDVALGGGGSAEDVTPGFWPSRLHESIKVRQAWPSDYFLKFVISTVDMYQG